MLQVPKSLLRRWSDYRPVIIDSEALLRSVLDDEPATVPASLRLMDIYRFGWRSREARGWYAESCRRLTQWCVMSKRYLNNVAIYQEIKLSSDNDLWCAPIVPDSSPRLTLRERIGALLAHALQPRAAPTGHLSLSDRRYQHRMWGEIPSWSMAVRELEDGALVLIDAPLCLSDEEGAGQDAFLCDYAPFMRRPADPRVPIRLSDSEREVLRATLADGAAWHPFTRVLGIVRHGIRGDSLQVLQIALRVPIPDEGRYTHKETWAEGLLTESKSIDLVIGETNWLGKAVSSFHENKAKTGAAGTSLGEAVRDHSDAFKRYVLAHSSDTDWAITRDYGTPYENVDAFWCALAAVLPAWRDHFSLTRPQASALLAAFDKRYDEKWRSIANDLDGIGAIRYSPSVLATVRSRLENLLQQLA